MPIESKLTVKINGMKWIIPLCFAFMSVITVLGIVLCMVRGFDGMQSEFAFSIGADIFSMAVALMIGFSMLGARKGAGGYTRIFATLLVLNTMALFLDECSWLVQGNPHLVAWNLVINVFYFANSAALVYFFWRYVVYALNLESKFMRVIDGILNVLFIPNVLACFVNFFYPLYFTVDASGTYARVESTWIYSQAYLAVGIIAVILALVFSKATLKTKLVTGSFISIPLIHQALVRYSFGISTQYAAMLVSIVLIYGVLFADREKVLAATTGELSLATRIQADMLPNIFPAFPDRSEFDVYATMTPAKEVGGDFYDFFLIDDDHLALVMADVSGKGVPAALFMMVSKILVQNYAMTGKSPKEILESVNSQICKNNREDMFVTVWLGVLDVKTGILTAANAGHEYPVVKKPNGDFEFVKDKHGFVIGGMDGAKYKEYEIVMQPGAKLFVYTDGVLEAMDASGKLFGAERLLLSLAKSRDKSAGEILKTVAVDISDFAGEAPQFDDITMLCLEYIGNADGDFKEITLSADLQNVPEVTEFINGELEKAGCPQKVQNQIDVAADELFCNIAQYAYGEETGSVTVKIRTESEPSSAMLIFIDGGKPYNPLELKEPDVSLPAEKREIGGLGVFLVKKTMDEVDYEYKDGKNILTIKKYFNNR